MLILTERSRVEDRIRGLDSGADDYMPKPFSLAELTARIRAVTRRARLGSGRVVKMGDLEMDRLSRVVRRGTQPISLTSREFELLDYLVQNAGQCVTRAMIIENVWKFVPDTMTNVVDVPISTARFASNWELSTSRATEIVRLFITQYEMAPARLAGAGYAEYRPSASNDTPEGRAMNRRVDIVILPDVPPAEEAANREVQPPHPETKEAKP